MKLIFIILFTSSLIAQNFSTRYDVNVGMFGKVGYADLIVTEDANTYEAKLSAIIVGVAATLTGNRVETFVSKGKIVDGIYIPDTFVKTKTTNTKSRIQTYYFNHDEKNVKLIQKKTKLVSTSRFDTTDFSIVYEDVNVTSQEESILDTYIFNDVLSTYLNLQTDCDIKPKDHELIAIGAYNHKNHVTLSCLEGSQKTEAMLRFSTAINNIFNLHVQPLDEDDETVDVLVAYDKNGFMKEAILGEVFWIGKITADRVEHKIVKN